jgi:hypothetical protein
MRASVVFPLLCIAAVAIAGESETNLRVLQGLGRGVGQEMREKIGSRALHRPVLRVLPRDAGLYLEQDIAEAFRDLPESGGDSTEVLEIGIVDARVLYEDLRRDGWFGTRVMDRSVTLAVRMRFTERDGPGLRAEFSRSLRDTVEVDLRESLELPGVPMSTGTLPPQGVWQDLMEPLIIVGSIAVAVALLFAVRS